MAGTSPRPCVRCSAQTPPTPRGHRCRPRLDRRHRRGARALRRGSTRAHPAHRAGRWCRPQLEPGDGRGDRRVRQARLWRRPVVPGHRRTPARRVLPGCRHGGSPTRHRGCTSGHCDERTRPVRHCGAVERPSRASPRRALRHQPVRRAGVRDVPPVCAAETAVGCVQALPHRFGGLRARARRRRCRWTRGLRWRVPAQLIAVERPTRQ